MIPELGAFPLAGIVSYGHMLRLESNKRLKRKCVLLLSFPTEMSRAWEDVQWLFNGYKHLVLFQRTWVQVPATTWLLPAGCNSCFRDSNALF